MTEAEWLAANEPTPMLEFLRGRVSDRKLRLFAVACCRHFWPCLDDERLRQAVEVAERCADGLASSEEQDAAAVAADAAADDTHGGNADAADTAADAIQADAAIAAQAAATTFLSADAAVNDAERSARAALVRDIFGSLPFRPLPPLAPRLLDWHGGAIVKLAQAIYEERSLPSGHLDAGRLAVLADMLEESGCTDAELLGHLRSPGQHVRGCVAVDAILGKS